MRKVFMLLMILCTFNYQLKAQSDCSNPIIICGNTTAVNPSGVGNELEYLACGGIEHNSVWFAFQAKGNGVLNFVVRPTTLAGLPALLDVDWSLFQLPGAPGTTNCNNKIQLSCNFAGTGTVFGIPGATGLATPPYAATQFNPGVNVVAGNWYAIMVDQFSNTTPTLISIQFTGNTEFAGLNTSPPVFENKPDFNVVTTNACMGIFDFNSTSVATSGISSYQWDFGDGTTGTGANVNHTYTAPGNYYVALTVTDNNGCATLLRKLVVYNQTVPIIANAGILSLPACSDQNNGSITISTIGANTLGVSGGTPPYQFELVAPSATIRSAQASNTFTGLQAGSYFVKATDLCGRSAISTVVTVTQVVTNSNIGLGIQNIQSACGSSPTGSATIFANGTTPPYTMALVSQSPVVVAPTVAVQRDPITATYYTTFNNLLPGLYTVEAFDACGKARRATFTVSPSITPIAISVSSPSCINAPTGTISVTATGATGLSGSGSPGAYQYALIAPSVIVRPFQNGSYFQNLLPGNYTVAVRDACGNIGTSTVSITQAVAPNFGTSFSTASCPNGSTGTIEVQLGTIPGGGGIYNYALVAPSPVLRPNQTSNLFTALPPGTYTVRLTDGCATSATTTVTVAAATAPSFTTALTTSCSTPSSGTITVIPSATNIGPYSFELISPGAAIRVPQQSNVANTFNSIFRGLSQGNYTVKMTDGCNVPVTNSVTIAAPTALAFPAGTTTVPSCAATPTGRIVAVAPTTGLGAYKYALIAPSPAIRPTQNSRIFDGLPPGNYTVQITDSCGTQVDNGATAITIATATAPAFTVTNTASCAAGTGTITCLPTASQGSGIYQFALIAPSPVTRPNQTSTIFTGLPAGAYTVQITDQCGLTSTQSTTIAAAGAFTPAAGGSIVSCNGTNYNGQIIITNPQNFTTAGPIPIGSGGGPFTYALYDATNTTLLAGPQTSNIFTIVVPVAGLPSHTIRVTDVCGNTSTTTATINPPTALSAATITAVTASCSVSNNGVIRVSTISSGGLPPYAYTLINSANNAVVAGPQTGLVFNNVPANAAGYLVTTTDACGNTITSATPLTFAAAVTPTATVVTTASCVSSPTGRIVVTPATGATLAGGTFTYALYDAANTVLISPNQSQPVFNNIAAGGYTVRLTDVCGSVGTVTATVTFAVTAPSVTGTVVSPSCSAGNTGVITVTSTGGSLPITYTLIDQVTSNVLVGPQSDNIFNNLPVGSYIVRVTDACGTVANSANISVIAATTPPTITTSVAYNCAGSAVIGVFGAGGSGGPYTYAICNGAGCATFGSFATNNLFTVNTNSTYRVAVRDACSNQVSSADIIITIPSKPQITSIANANACGSTTITPSFVGIANTPYYSLDGANFSASIGTVAPGCHNLRVADFNLGTFGCASDLFEFNVLGLPTLTVPDAAAVNCNTGFVTISGTGGTKGCASSTATLAVKLTACIGCSAAADPIGTIKTLPGTFNLGSATSASFVPAIADGATEICAGVTPLNVNFLGAPYNCVGALPVGLLSFTGKKDGKINKLQWTTSSEQNNSGFEVAVSKDGIQFNSIGFVATQANGGNSNVAITYNFNDVAPAGAIQYYRLKQIDHNNAYTYSNIVVIKNNVNKEISIDALQPNPTKADIQLSISSTKKELVVLYIADLTGKVIKEKAVTLNIGNNIIPISVKELAAGTYLVKMISVSSGPIDFAKFIKL